MVLDPTLLIGREKWDEIKSIVDVEEKYVLRYMLGDMPIEANELINKIYGDIKIVDVGDLLCGNGGIIGPSEFLSLVEQAEMVCTDSYHACIFSTLYKKPFVIFDRHDTHQSMSSRIDTLCSTLDLDSHRFNSSKFNIDEVLSFNFDKTFELLYKEKYKSLTFLKCALTGDENLNE